MAPRQNFPITTICLEVGKLSAFLLHEVCHELPILEGSRLGSTDHAVLKAYPSTKAPAYPPGVFMLGLVATSKNDVSRIRVKKQKTWYKKAQALAIEDLNPFPLM